MVDSRMTQDIMEYDTDKYVTANSFGYVSYIKGRENGYHDDDCTYMYDVFLVYISCYITTKGH